VKEIEFCDQSQDLSVFHHWERIEVAYCSNNVPSWLIVVCRSTVKQYPVGVIRRRFSKYREAGSKFEIIMGTKEFQS
jgi:hypothetical protein